MASTKLHACMHALAYRKFRGCYAEKNSLESRSRATVLEPLTIDMCRPTNRSRVQAPVSLAARSFSSQLAHPSRRKRCRLRKVGSVILVDAVAWCWNRRHQGAATDRITSLTSALGLAHVIYRSDRLGSEILLLFSCASSSPPFLDLVWSLDSRRNNGGRRP
jgi:hypothetical protein